MTADKENHNKVCIELDAEDLDKIVGGASGKIASSPIDGVRKVQEQEKKFSDISKVPAGK